MKRALLLHGSKQTPVTVEETSDGGLIVHLLGKVLFRLEPVAEAVSWFEPARALTVAERRWQLKQFILSKEYLRQPKAKKQALLIEYFSMSDAVSDEDMDNLVQDLKADYKETAGQRYEATEQSEGQLEQDLRILKRHAEKIINDAGELVRGWQSRIAEYLNLPGTGGSHHRRIRDLGDALREFYSSTTVEDAENEVETENKRLSSW